LHHPLDSVDVANSDDVKHTVIDAHTVFLSGIWSRALAILQSKVLTHLVRALEERFRLDGTQNVVDRSGYTGDAHLGGLTRGCEYFYH